MLPGGCRRTLKLHRECALCGCRSLACVALVLMKLWSVRRVLIVDINIVTLCIGCDVNSG